MRNQRASAFLIGAIALLLGRAAVAQVDGGDAGGDAGVVDGGSTDASGDGGAPDGEGVDLPAGVDVSSEVVAPVDGGAAGAPDVAATIDAVTATDVAAPSDVGGSDAGADARSDARTSDARVAILEDDGGGCAIGHPGRSGGSRLASHAVLAFLAGALFWRRRRRVVGSGRGEARHG